MSSQQQFIITSKHLNFCSSSLLTNNYLLSSRLYIWQPHILLLVYYYKVSFMYSNAWKVMPYIWINCASENEHIFNKIKQVHPHEVRPKEIDKWVLNPGKAWMSQEALHLTNPSRVHTCKKLVLTKHKTEWEGKLQQREGQWLLRPGKVQNQELALPEGQHLASHTSTLDKPVSNDTMH